MRLVLKRHERAGAVMEESCDLGSAVFQSVWYRRVRVLAGVPPAQGHMMRSNVRSWHVSIVSAGSRYGRCWHLGDIARCPPHVFLEQSGHWPRLGFRATNDQRQQSWRRKQMKAAAEPPAEISTLFDIDALDGPDDNSASPWRPGTGATHRNFRCNAKVVVL